MYPDVINRIILNIQVLHSIPLYFNSDSSSRPMPCFSIAISHLTFPATSSLTKFPITVWHMWMWYLGEPDDAGNFKCEIAIKKRGMGREDESELKYSGRVHSIRIPPHRIILSGCLLSFSDYTAAFFRYLGEGHQGHPVIDYKVSVSRNKKPTVTPSNERVMAAGLSKMLRRFSIDTTGSKANKANFNQDNSME